MKDNNEGGFKGGFTVSEIEGTAKKFASEIGLAVIFIVTAIFTLIWGGSMMVWSILLCMILAIVGACTPNSMMNGLMKALDFVYKEKTILIATGIVLLVVGIFIPVLIFALVGLIAGGYLSESMKRKGCGCDGDTGSCETKPSSKEETKTEENKPASDSDNTDSSS